MSTRLCYNRGCGKQYNPRDNPENSCQYHPGAPFFHDAYKGWTCCGTKCTDFTEFLNTPGCSKGQHTNVKPEEPESITGKIGEANDSSREATPTRESLESKIRLPRPDPAKTPLTRMKPTVAVSLVQANQSLEIRNGQSEASVAIEVGESCKNGGCKEVWVTIFWWIIGGVALTG